MEDHVIPEYQDRNLFRLFDGHFRTAYTHNLLAEALLQQFHRDIENHKAQYELLLDSSFIINKLLKKDNDTAYLSWSRILDQSSEGYTNSLFFSRLNALLNQNLLDRSSREFPRGLPSVRNGEPFLLEDVVDWINQEAPELPQPFLGYFHFLPPHIPYNTRADFVNVFKDDGYLPLEKPVHLFNREKSYDELAAMRRDYDEFILYADAEFGRLIQNLEESGLMENSIVVFTSDHGEMFERGIFEHTSETLFQPLMHIPLLIHTPGQQTREDIYTPSSAVDVLPTLLHLNQKSIPEWIEGEVLPPYRQDPLEKDRSIYGVEAKKINQLRPLRRSTLMLVKWPFKIVRYSKYPELSADEMFEFFNLEEDPEELNNLYSHENSIAQEMREELEAQLAEADAPYSSE